MSGDATQHAARGTFIRDAARQPQKPIRRDRSLRRIATARHRAVRDTVSDLDRVDLWSDRLDHPCTLDAENRRKLRQRIRSGAMVHIDIVHPSERLPHENFARTGGRKGDLLAAQGFEGRQGSECERLVS
jgi:hypothetical protein